jgi:putative glutamine amidotransferase
MKPVIGITTSEDARVGGKFTILSEDYVRSVAAGGGLPVALPLITDTDDFEACLEAFDGILFSGGVDISPLRYGEDPIRQVNVVNSRRDEFELRLFARARSLGMPILGICRGHQLVNIAMGGTLYQDISTQLPEALGHFPQLSDDSEPYHSLRITDKNSRLFAVLGTERIDVNSFHHQAVKNLGAGLRITALSSDGLVEGFEGEEGGFLMGVQFHPEGMSARFPVFVRIFSELIRAAEEYRAR